MNDQKKNLLKAKVSLSLLNVLGRRPTTLEIEKYTIAAQVLWKTVCGTKSARSWMKKNNQLAIF